MRSDENGLESNRFSDCLASIGFFENGQWLANAARWNSLASTLDKLAFDEFPCLCIEAQAASNGRVCRPKIVDRETIRQCADIQGERRATSTSFFVIIIHMFFVICYVLYLNEMKSLVKRFRKTFLFALFEQISKINQKCFNFEHALFNFSYCRTEINLFFND